MAIQVKYFASLRERMGRAEDAVSPVHARTVAELWAHITGGKPLPANTLVAVNLEYADLDHPVKEGDEVAFFPPVTGG